MKSKEANTARRVQICHDLVSQSNIMCTSNVIYFNLGWSATRFAFITVYLKPKATNVTYIYNPKERNVYRICPYRIVQVIELCGVIYEYLYFMMKGIM